MLGGTRGTLGVNVGPLEHFLWRLREKFSLWADHSIKLLLPSFALLEGKMQHQKITMGLRETFPIRVES